jgi:hypothetical protein
MRPAAVAGGVVLYVVMVGWLMLHGHLDAAVWLILLAIVGLLAAGVDPRPRVEPARAGLLEGAVHHAAPAVLPRHPGRGSANIIDTQAANLL